MLYGEILNAFYLNGRPISCERFGNGNINGTFLVGTDRGKTYILQLVNHHVFTDLNGLMNNIIAVTDWLRTKDRDPRHVLRLIPLKTGGYLYTDRDDKCWRITEFVDRCVTIDVPEEPSDFEKVGRAFGNFQQQLSDFPPGRLAETIPHFHDTPMRYEQLRQAVRENRAGRADSVTAEIDAAFGFEKYAPILTDLAKTGELPLRVTHNDAKTSNILLDADSHEPVCVIDLDTVMPGLVGCDFGDAIRSGAATAPESEADLSKVLFSLDMYDAFAKGFLSACGSDLNKAEIETLPYGAILMTLECGIRFLADYLNGDIYFNITTPTMNLDKTRNQFKLITEMEKQLDEMKRIVKKYGKI